MFNLVRAELVKNSRLPLVKVLVLAPLAATVILSLLVIFIKLAGNDFGSAPQGSLGLVDLGGGVFAFSSQIVLTGIGALYALATVIVGGQIVSHEYGWSTIKMIATREPSRPRLILAKAIFLALFALVMVGVFILSWLIYGFALKIAYNQPFGLVEGDGEALGKGLKYIFLAFVQYLIWGLLALALAIQFKSAVTAVIFYLIYSGIDNLASGLGTAALRGVLGTNFPAWLDPLIQASKLLAPFLINTNYNRLAGSSRNPQYVETISPIQSWLVLAAWSALFILMGIQVFVKRDITD